VLVQVLLLQHLDVALHEASPLVNAHRGRENECFLLILDFEVDFTKSVDLAQS